MSWFVDDFSCPNEDCEQYDIRTEVIYDKHKEVPTCEKCETILTKLVTGLRSTHVSWSLWKVDGG